MQENAATFPHCLIQITTMDLAKAMRFRPKDHDASAKIRNKKAGQKTRFSNRYFG